VTNAFNCQHSKGQASCKMLALTTTDALTLIDPITLKSAPSSVPSCQLLLSRPTASSWSPDNSSLFISSSSDIHKYEPSSNSLHHIYSTSNSDSISHLVAKDKGGTLIFSVSQIIHVLDCSSGKITQSYDSHKSPITSLALSNDSTLLATASAGAAHVHNLTHGSYTVLRGLPLPGTTINACVFHPHSRTRLLLGVGRQLLVYDSTRPSGPMKTIAMSESTTGEINYVACSPFSKTLVAFATSAGNVFLVDLEKEKGYVMCLFRLYRISFITPVLAFLALFASRSQSLALHSLRRAGVSMLAQKTANSSSSTCVPLTSRQRRLSSVTLKPESRIYVFKCV
jgi:protein NEDD1